MLVLRNENVGNFQNGCKGERYGLAHSVGCYCCTCIHGFSYDLHYRTTSRLTFLYSQIFHRLQWAGRRYKFLKLWQNIHAKTAVKHFRRQVICLDAQDAGHSGYQEKMEVDFLIS